MRSEIQDLATGVVYCFDAEVLLCRLASTRTSLILMPFSFARVAIVSSTRLMREEAKLYFYFMSDR